jgi:hypothetical protein
MERLMSDQNAAKSIIADAQRKAQLQQARELEPVYQNNLSAASAQAFTKFGKLCDILHAAVVILLAYGTTCVLLDVGRWLLARYT